MHGIDKIISLIGFDDQIRGWDNRRRNWSCCQIARAFQLECSHSKHAIEVVHSKVAAVVVLVIGSIAP